MTKTHLALRNFANTPKNLKIFSMQEILIQSQIVILLTRMFYA